ncbi:MAG: TonB-dependent receptor [Gammaproteobacteria bacterium]|nr:TonB-dependent receptor [Gammaproteobacteria bacterium]
MDRRAVAALCALGLLPFALAAAADPGEIVVTGTRLAIPVGAEPAGVTVFDRRDIEATGETALPELLRRVSGVQVVQPGAGGVTQLFMRGSEPNFVIVLIDGVRVNDPNNTRGGSFDFAAVNLDDIERIEIVRGPQSSIYGSDGLAGVIQIFSREASVRPSAALRAAAGMDGYRSLGGSAAGTAAPGGFSLYANYRDDGEAVPGSRYEATTVGARWQYAEEGRWSGVLQLRYVDTEGTSYPEQSGGPELAVLDALDERSAHDLIVGGATDFTLAPSMLLRARLGHYRRRDAYDSPGIAPGDLVPPNGAENELDRSEALLHLVQTGDGAWQGTAGVDWHGESGESVGYVQFGPDLVIPNDFALDRATVGVFAEARWQAADTVQLAGSLRHDDPDTASSQTTGRIGATWRLAGDRTELHAQWGSGFKLPSFFALGSPLVGEPNLRPETSESLEIGWRQQLGVGRRLTLTWFDNAFADLIDFDPETFRNVNRSRVTTRGVEARLDWQVDEALVLRAHATQTDIEVRDSDRQLLQRPDWYGGAGLTWTPGADWSLDADWQYLGNVPDNSLVTGPVRLGAYHRVDLSLRWQVSRRLTLSLAIDNALAAEYQESIGFPAAGARARIGISCRIGE